MNVSSIVCNIAIKYTFEPHVTYTNRIGVYARYLIVHFVLFPGIPSPSGGGGGGGDTMDTAMGELKIERTHGLPSACIVCIVFILFYV